MRRWSGVSERKTPGGLLRVRASLGEPPWAVVQGGVDVASRFSALPFDHIIFTGSAPYREILLRAVNPAFIIGLARYLLAALADPVPKAAVMDGTNEKQ